MEMSKPVVAALLTACACARHPVPLYMDDYDEGDMWCPKTTTSRATPFDGHPLVTVAEYASCVRAEKCSPLGAIREGTEIPRKYVRMPEDYPRQAVPDNPVRWVSFSQAVAYCDARGMHVPSESEYVQVRDILTPGGCYLRTSDSRLATTDNQEWLLDWAYGYFRKPDLETGRINCRKVAPFRGVGGYAPEFGYEKVGFRCLPGPAPEIKEPPFSD